MKTKNLRKTNLEESTKNSCTFAYLHICTFLFICLFAHLPNHTSANALSITNVTLSGSNLSFNITWQNSWNVTQTPINNDAVWVFVKCAV